MAPCIELNVKYSKGLFTSTGLIHGGKIRGEGGFYAEEL